MPKIVIKNRYKDRSSEEWTARGFDTKEEAETYLQERLANLWGYGATGSVHVREDNGEISVSIHCYNSCD